MGIFAKRKLTGTKHQTVPQRQRIFGQPNSNRVQQSDQLSGPLLPNDLASLENCQIALQVHLARLKELKTLPEKADYKAKVLGDLQPFVDEYVAQDHYYPNDVAVWLMVWLFDVGRIEQAINLGLLLVNQDQKLPGKFGSDLVTFICDYTYDYAAAKFKDNESAQPYFDQVFTAMNDQDWQLHEVVEGKIYAMAAKLATQTKDHTKVVEYGTKALQINPKAGVKKLVDKATRALAKQQAN